MQKVIVATDQDGLNVRTCVIVLDVQDGVDAEKAVRDACKEYCQTEEGKQTYIGNCESFNWGDFDAYVPNSICQKHGFTKIDFEVNTENVDFNEQLVYENDVFGDEEE